MCHIVPILLFWRGILASRRVRIHSGVSVQPELPRTHKKHPTLSADLALIGRLGCLQRVEKLPSGQYSPQIRHEMHPLWICSSPVCGLNELGADFLDKLTPSARCGEKEPEANLQPKEIVTTTRPGLRQRRRSAHRCIAASPTRTMIPSRRAKTCKIWPPSGTPSTPPQSSAAHPQLNLLLDGYQLQRLDAVLFPLLLP